MLSTRPMQTASYVNPSASADDDAKVTETLTTSDGRRVAVTLSASAADYESTFDGLLVERFALYKNIVNGINDKLSVLPPSGAVAGAYALIDRTAESGRPRPTSASVRSTARQSGSTPSSKRT